MSSLCRIDDKRKFHEFQYCGYTYVNPEAYLPFQVRLTNPSSYGIFCKQTENLKKKYQKSKYVLFDWGYFKWNPDTVFFP